MGLINIDNITKEYAPERGNFNISLEVKKGETIGLVGENGAGKTTLLRQIMGFIKSDSGKITINNLDAYNNASELKRIIGYIPGEINFPDYKTGNEFLKNYIAVNNLPEESTKLADSIIKRMQLDITAYPKRMSKGMKQKTAIVASLIKQAPILLADEPTTGLDPLMRDEFLKLVLEEKQKGTTIIMSSNTIEELEKVADRVVFISKGKIVDIGDVKKIDNETFNDYKIEFLNKKDYQSSLKHKFFILLKKKDEMNQISIRIEKTNLNKLFEFLKGKKIKFISQIPYDLQTYFDERRKEN